MSTTEKTLVIRCPKCGGDTALEDAMASDLSVTGFFAFYSHEAVMILCAHCETKFWWLTRIEEM